MRWHIEGPIRAVIHAFTGINFSGQRVTIDIWPRGGKQEGDPLEGHRLKSIGMIAPLGTRVILCASASDDWERLPWRAFEIREGFTFMSRDDKLAVQLPDIDYLDNPDALRTDTEWPSHYPTVERASERPSWTYGRSGATELKCNIRQIRVDRVG